jgi:hypothetical protein
MATLRTVQAIEDMYRDDIQQVIAESGLLMPEKVEEPFRSRIVAVYEDVRTRCELFPEEYQEDCFLIVYPILPVQLRKDEALYNELCSRVLPDPVLADYCVRTRLIGMGAF